jgi:hypothetical protein
MRSCLCPAREGPDNWVITSLKEQSPLCQIHPSTAYEEPGFVRLLLWIGRSVGRVVWGGSLGWRRDLSTSFPHLSAGRLSSGVVSCSSNAPATEPCCPRSSEGLCRPWPTRFAPGMQSMR